MFCQLPAGLENMTPCEPAVIHLSEIHMAVTHLFFLPVLSYQFLYQYGQFAPGHILQPRRQLTEHRQSAFPRLFQYFLAVKTAQQLFILLLFCRGKSIIPGNGINPGTQPYRDFSIS